MANVLGLKMGQWTQGVDFKEILSGGAGLAATTMVPGMIVKTTLTTGTKLAKLGVSLGLAIVAGMALKAVAGPQAGKAAFIGGVAGTVIQGIGMFTPIVIGNSGMGALPVGRRLGETLNIAPSFSREQEQVQLIRP